MKDLIDLVGPAITKVLRVGTLSRRFVGTAFAVNDHIALTCRHVVQGDEKLGSLVLDGGHLGDIGRIRWSLPDDKNLDVALGITEERTFSQWLTPSCVDVRSLPTPIACLGYGSDNCGLKVWRDHIAGEARAYGLVALQNSLDRGCSGGPALDVEKHPVAVNVARNSDGTVKYILPVRSFYAWMQERGFRPMAHGQQGPSSRCWLLNVPIAPPVRLHEVPHQVIDAFAQTLHREKTAREHLAAANALVLKNNPEHLGDRQITLPEGDQPGFDVPREFWSTVFSILGSKSRRSVAAILEATHAPNPQAQSDRTRQAFERFRRFLLKED